LPKLLFKPTTFLYPPAFTKLLITRAICSAILD
jgi:hypothetical protein